MLLKLFTNAPIQVLGFILRGVAGAACDVCSAAARPWRNLEKCRVGAVDRPPSSSIMFFHFVEPISPPPHFAAEFELEIESLLFHVLRLHCSARVAKATGSEPSAGAAPFLQRVLCVV